MFNDALGEVRLVEGRLERRARLLENLPSLLRVSKLDATSAWV